MIFRFFLVSQLTPVLLFTLANVGAPPEMKILSQSASSAEMTANLPGFSMPSAPSLDRESKPSINFPCCNLGKLKLSPAISGIIGGGVEFKLPL